MDYSVAIYVEVYDNIGAYKGTYQSGAGDLIDCIFSHDESGCKGFSLNFATYVDIEKKDIIKIKIFDNDDYFFTGVVRQIPIDGSTKQEYIYSGFGLNDYLVRTNTEIQTYNNKTIRYIVEDLLDNIITLKTPINKNLGKLSALTTTITQINFNYIQINEALDQLRKIANTDGNDYRVGVDREGDFIFIVCDTDIKATLVVGKDGQYGIDEYEPQESYEAKSKLFVLDKDGNFHDTYSSMEDIDIYEQKLTAPDIHVNDIDNWAKGQLYELEVETRQAQVIWKIETENPTILVANGNLRIISNVPPIRKISGDDSFYGQGKYGNGLYGGVGYAGKDLDDELKIVEVTYTIDASNATRTIQLGSLPIELDREILKVRKNIEDLRISIGR